MIHIPNIRMDVVFVVISCYFGVLLHHPSHISAQGTTNQPPQNLAYFNSTAQATVNTVLNLGTGIVFSFRTCNGGEILSQTGTNGDYIQFQVVSSTGAFHVQWTVGGVSDTVTLGRNLNINSWTLVEVESKLGDLVLTVANYTRILNSTLRNIDLNGGNLIIGRTYEGCIQEVSGLNLASSNDYTNVLWGQCPLDFENGCGAPIIDPCYSLPCQHSGLCTNLGDSYVCECTARYSGSNCQIDTGPLCQDPVYRKDCQNGGFCKEDATGNYTFCQCPAEYEGELCERPANYCAPMPCQNGGICHTNDANDGYTCECLPGWSGVNCDLNIDECGSSPCFNAGKCVDSINGYTCDCTDTGYEGQRCETDIDECERNSPCQNGATCTDMIADYFCTCVDGYDGDNCETELDECSSTPCQNGATCTDLLDNYECICTSEWMGRNCAEQYDPCVELTPCQNNGSCVSTPPSPDYTCACMPGFDGDNCENNIDECIGETCPNPGEVCFDLINGFECRCPDGFEGDGCATDINECASNPCMNGGRCVDEIGFYICNCTYGFDGTNCEIDVDFCDGTCKNGAICQEKDPPEPPGYDCFCKPGFSGNNCERQFDECLSDPCINGGTCVDEVNGYTCLCAPGFTGATCQIDIDECASSPCENSATCQDMINGYLCQCPLGFNGTECEIEINECDSSPCMNGGYCMDLINGYKCNCTDTGFSGDSCEINIDDCAPQPCQNSATCVDKIKDYDCNCYLGYDGKNCEVDINECGSLPCQNGGQCFEMSDPENYDPNFEHRDLFPDEFNYANASGYLCVCLDGFDGVECEINIDECASDPCANSGTCIDRVNGYRCECASGWEGADCTSEINECDSNPCQNSGSCTDIVNGYTCSCTAEYGGLNCEVLLIACMGNTECQNAATCVPFYDPNAENHYFTCTCAVGYTGARCEVSTAVSFRDGSHMVDTSTNNKQTLTYSLAFATTLPSGLLLYSGDNGDLGDYILLEMFESQLFFTYSDMTVTGLPLTIDHLGDSLSDGEWHTVELIITDLDITLSVTGVSDTNELSSDCTNGKCSKTISRNSYVANLDSLYIGGLGSSIENRYSLTRSGVHFTGCKQDIMNEDRYILPPSLDGTATGNAQPGCSRTDQCNPDPCFGNGGCTDLWWTYECECKLGYTGPSCSYSFTPGTFSFEDSTSHAMFSANAPLSLDENLIRLRFRTREQDGLLFHTSDGTSYITLQLKNGGVSATADFNGGTHVITLDTHDYSDAIYHSVILNRRGGDLSLQVDNSKTSEQFNNATLPDFQDFYIGGDVTNSLPGADTVPNFKGCIQDVKYNNYSLEFYPLNIPDYTIDNLPMTDNNNVLEGCQSDDTCRTNPCENGGRCEVTWNDFECDCPNGFGGKNCSELTICAFNPCPYNVECLDREDGGYDCVTEATFNSEQSMITYTNSINVSRPLDTISLSLRTREEEGILLHSNNQLQGYFFTLEIISGKPRFRFDLGDGDTNTLEIDYVINDGEWHSIVIFVGSELTIGSVDSFNVSLPHSPQAPLQSAITQLGSSAVYLGAVDFSDNKFFDIYNSFDGCMDEVRIGEILLPFFTETMYNSTSVENFYATITDVSINCTSDPICDSNPCQNDGLCQDLWNEYECDCLPGFAGTLCEININECAENPCLMGSTCVDGINNFTCSCLPGYEGRLCDIDINECASNPCQNNAIGCKDLVNGFECNCTANFTGRRCEFLVSMTCDDMPCRNGATCISIDDAQPGENAYRCDCVPGYEGENCAYEIDYCANHTCQNGATCNSSLDLLDYVCHCIPGYDGRYCEINIDECEGVLCQNGGTCLDFINRYECSCVPGYEGTHCESEIDECLSSPCKNGATCQDRINDFQCICQEGYEGELCELVGPCVNDPCQNGGTCTQKLNDNDKFTYTCLCPIGFNGTDCENEIDWCDSNPCQQQGSNCTSDRLGFNCTCAPGYGGDVCEIKLPDCASGLCQNGATCIDYDYRYECVCVPGFVGDQCETNFDECGSTPCLNEGRCVDKVNGYTCDCSDTGYEGTTCETDINECLQEICENGGTCENFPGNYKCECVEGFIGQNCQAKDPCLDLPCLNDAIDCEPVEYNKTVYVPRCTCKDGYEGQKCEQRTGGDPTPVNWIVIGVVIGIVFLLILFIIIIAFVVVVKNKRATQGTYSPSRQEITGSRVEMDNVLKLPPEERLI